MIETRKLSCRSADMHRGAGHCGPWVNLQNLNKNKNRFFTMNESWCKTGGWPLTSAASWSAPPEILYLNEQAETREKGVGPDMERGHWTAQLQAPILYNLPPLMAAGPTKGLRLRPSAGRGGVNESFTDLCGQGVGLDRPVSKQQTERILCMP
jgi:hypothetical protein